MGLPDNSKSDQKKFSDAAIEDTQTIAIATIKMTDDGGCQICATGNLVNMTYMNASFTSYVLQALQGTIPSQPPQPGKDND
jgi:hypothetical protein